MDTEGDSLDVTPEMALIDALKDVQHKYKDDPPDKLVIIALWQGGENYDTSFWNSGMCISEIIGLLEIQKMKLFNQEMDEEE